MLLTITSHAKENANHLGFLLHKHPDEFQSFDLAFGKCFVFYPEVEENICTVSLLIDIDPVKLVRSSQKKGSESPLSQYVNDRPYVASSFMSVALGKVFRTAMNGQCNHMPELPDTPLPLSACLSSVPVKGGEGFLRRMFEPLGYEVKVTRLNLDQNYPQWGMSKLFNLELSGHKRLKELLNHLYVLIPVIDTEKHYFVGDQEIDKLVRRGEDWLTTHPHKEEIARRYLRNKKSLALSALDRLLSEEMVPNEEIEESQSKNSEDSLEEKISLNEARLKSVLDKLKELGSRRVVDLGCGEGKLLKALLDDFHFTRILGVDVSIKVLEMANKRLRLDRLPERKAKRLQLIQGSLMYRDKRLKDFEAATCIEVIEHLDKPRLQSFEDTVFKHTAPPVVIITTPNAEYNRLFPNLEPGQFRHKDHRFEWTRTEFTTWTKHICQNHGYHVEILPVGDLDAVHGPPTQMGVFTRGD